MHVEDESPFKKGRKKGEKMTKDQFFSCLFTIFFFEPFKLFLVFVLVFLYFQREKTELESDLFILH